MKRFMRVAGALTLGSLVGVWWIWQDTRDERLLAVYACAHNPARAWSGPEEAWNTCEEEIP